MGSLAGCFAEINLPAQGRQEQDRASYPLQQLDVTIA
jgi:hypothetical protein